jgi:penicillin amidase
MRASVWKLSVLILAVAVVATGQSLKPMTTTRMAPMKAPGAVKDDAVTTTRDARGVWFIEGGSLYDVYEAMGYAVATDRLFQMDLFRRQGDGRLSELLGPSQVSTDIGLRMFSYSDDELAQQFANLSPDGQTVIQAYVDGINRRIGEFYAGDWHSMPHEYWMLSFQSVFQYGQGAVLPTPFTVNDILGWIATLTRFFDPEGDFASNNFGQLDNYTLLQTLAAVYPAEYGAMFTDLRWINDPSALTYIPPSGSKSVAGPAVRFPAIKKDAPDLGGVADRLRQRATDLNDSLEALNARVRMGSYAWVVSGDKTASGNPIVYSGPQMGFETPSIVTEGSIRGGGYNVSGMTVPGIPGIIIGRTPHHAWSMQVGHAHTVDYYLEAPQTVSFNRYETIHVLWGEDVTIPIFRSAHGPIIEPFPYDPSNPPSVIVSWAYSHWMREAQAIDAFLMLAKAESMAEFDAAIAMVPVSQHFTYADRDGNIAYWMAGYDPVRQSYVDPRFPSIADGTMEWTGARRTRVHDENVAKGWYGGWNNKSQPDYNNATNNYSYYFGPAHRAQVIDDYLSTHDNLTYEEVRDLALNIATTDSFGGGGNTWAFVADDFKAAVAADPSDDRNSAVAMLDAWDGHFVDGGPAQWRFGTSRADAWVLQDGWIREVLRITFEDEFRAAGMSWEDQPKTILFNVLVHALAGQTYYDWFQDAAGTGDKPVGAEAIILRALDNVIETVGLGPYNAQRGEIVYRHPIFGEFWRTPFSSRSTYAHCVEFDSNGPARIESMFPLGESGALYFNGYTTPVFDPNYFSMVPVFDAFMPRPFPLFN